MVNINEARVSLLTMRNDEQSKEKRMSVGDIFSLCVLILIFANVILGFINDEE